MKEDYFVDLWQCFYFPPRDGQWGEWREYSICDGTCPGGLAYSIRECTSPEPKYCGKPCDVLYSFKVDICPSMLFKHFEIVENFSRVEY